MAFLATRQRSPTEGSRTITLTESRSREAVDEAVADLDAESSTVGALRLRGASRNRPSVVWREDVVDNEQAGKKSSKICCIYHKPRAFDESSSEESSSDSSDSDSDSDCPHDHPHPAHAHRGRPRRQAPQPDGGRPTARGPQNNGVVHELHDHEDDANMYERNPAKKPKKGKMAAKSKAWSRDD